MRFDLTPKKTYTGPRCMASGILLGRMAAGLQSFERYLTNPESGHSQNNGVESAYKAAEKLGKLQTKARPHLKSLIENLGKYKEYSAYINKTKAPEDLANAKKDLSAIAQVVVQTCGKRRPQEGEGDALLILKTVKRERPAPRIDEPMALPELPPELPSQEAIAPSEPKVIVISEEPPAESLKGHLGSNQPGTPWAIIAGVALVIGAAFLVR